jgi:hypothetical protein
VNDVQDPRDLLNLVDDDPFRGAITENYMQVVRISTEPVLKCRIKEVKVKGGA